MESRKNTLNVIVQARVTSQVSPRKFPLNLTHGSYLANYLGIFSSFSTQTSCPFCNSVDEGKRSVGDTTSFDSNSKSNQTFSYSSLKNPSSIYKNLSYITTVMRTSYLCFQEDPTMNRLKESMRIFFFLSSSPFLTNVQMMLFLNKTDLFRLDFYSKGPSSWRSITQIGSSFVFYPAHTDETRIIVAIVLSNRTWQRIDDT